MIHLSDKVKDSITGFEGVVVARAEYLNGCIALQVQPAKLKDDGSSVKAEWFDEQRLTSGSEAKAEALKFILQKRTHNTSVKRSRYGKTQLQSR